MDTERARAFLLTLPHVVETEQWGDNLVFWVGDKVLGGKMFCMLDLNPGPHGVVSFAAGPERFHELLETDGLKPAPYFARIHWVAAERWSAVRQTEWENLFRNAHRVMHSKMPKRARDMLLLPAKEREAAIIQRRKVLAAKAKK